MRRTALLSGEKGKGIRFRGGSHTPAMRADPKIPNWREAGYTGGFEACN